MDSGNDARVFCEGACNLRVTDRPRHRSHREGHIVACAAVGQLDSGHQGARQDFDWLHAVGVSSLEQRGSEL